MRAAPAGSRWLPYVVPACVYAGAARASFGGTWIDPVVISMAAGTLVGLMLAFAHAAIAQVDSPVALRRLAGLGAGGAVCALSAALAPELLLPRGIANVLVVLCALPAVLVLGPLALLVAFARRRTRSVLLLLVAGLAAWLAGHVPAWIGWAMFALPAVLLWALAALLVRGRVPPMSFAGRMPWCRAMVARLLAPLVRIRWNGGATAASGVASMRGLPAGMAFLVRVLAFYAAGAVCIALQLPVLAPVSLAIADTLVPGPDAPAAGVEAQLAYWQAFGPAPALVFAVMWTALRGVVRRS